MKHQIFFRLLGRFAIAAGVLITSYYGLGLLAALALVAGYAVLWLRAGKTRQAAWHYAQDIVVGLGVVLTLNITIPPTSLPLLPAITKVVVAVLYGLWLARKHQTVTLTSTAITHAVGLSGVFLAVAYWHWVEVAAVVLCWLIAYSATRAYLEAKGERAATILAATWALIVGEVSWVLFGWQVLYDIGGGGYLIIPQVVIIVVGIGYCLSSIYSTHQQKQLSRSRLIEYVAVAGVLLAIIIAGTKWDTTI